MWYQVGSELAAEKHKSASLKVEFDARLKKWQTFHDVEMAHWKSFQSQRDKEWQAFHGAERAHLTCTLKLFHDAEMAQTVRRAEEKGIELLGYLDTLKSLHDAEVAQTVLEAEQKLQRVESDHECRGGSDCA